MARVDQVRLVDRLSAAMPRLDEREQRLAVALYRLLAEGQPVPPERLAERTGASLHEVGRLLEGHHGVYVDPQGSVVGFWGMALDGTPHRMLVRGHEVRAWCAWDSLFLPELLGEAAAVQSRCPTTGEKLSLTVEPGGVQEVSPAGAVLSFLAPPAAFDDDTINSFCHFVHFFASEAAATEWSAGRPDISVISIDDGWEIGRQTNRAVFGAALAGSER